MSSISWLVEGQQVERIISSKSLAIAWQQYSGIHKAHDYRRLA